MKVEKQSGYFTSFDGTEIYYESRGEGIPLIFCYGIGCLINHWIYQIKDLSTTYNTIVFDYRAHHKSGAPSDLQQMTVEAIAKDLNALIEHLKVKSPVIIGHSFGTQVLLKFHEMYPEVARGYISVNGFATNPVAGMFGNNFAENLFKFIKNGFTLLPETMTAFWRIGINNPVSMRLSALAGGFNINLTQYKDIEIYARGISSMDLKNFIPLFGDMIDFDGRSVFSSIDQPVLLIGGQKDALTPTDKQFQMHRRIKNSEIQIVPYGSHCTQLDFPDFVNLRIRKFLDDHWP